MNKAVLNGIIDDAKAAKADFYNTINDVRVITFTEQELMEFTQLQTARLRNTVPIANSWNLSVEFVKWVEEYRSTGDGSALSKKTIFRMQDAFNGGREISISPHPETANVPEQVKD